MLKKLATTQKTIALTSLFALLLNTTALADSLELKNKALPVGPKDKALVQKEIEIEREKQIAYHLTEMSQSKNPTEYLNSFGIEAENVTSSKLSKKQDISKVEDSFRELLDNAYIYTMDENGYVYDKEGEVVNKLNLDEEEVLTSERLTTIEAVAAATPTINNNINGHESGAFYRQQTNKGYKGIRTTFNLPIPSNWGIVDSPNTVGYLYSGLDILTTSGTTATIPFKIEGGFQYSPVTESYSAFIKPDGGSQNGIPEGMTTDPPRYKKGTSVISNLLYDNVSQQFKFFVNGTNVNNTSQYIYFFYSRSVTSQQLSDMTAKRLTALAAKNWKGSDLGEVTVSYGSTELTTTSGTVVNFNSSQLNTHIYNNGKIYGTAENITSTGSVTKTPATGNISSQTIRLNSN